MTVAASDPLQISGKVTCNGSVGISSGTAASAIPASVPAAYPQPLTRHQYHLNTFGITTPAPSAIISQSQTWRIESAWKPIRMPTATRPMDATYPARTRPASVISVRRNGW